MSKKMKMGAEVGRVDGKLLFLLQHVHKFSTKTHIFTNIDLKKIIILNNNFKKIG